MRRKARFYGIRWKLFFCLTAVTVGLLGITALAVNLVMRHYLEEAALEKYTFSSRFLELELEESFSELETETESFIFDAVIQRTLDSEPLTLLEQNTLSNVWNRISSKYVRNGVYLDNKGNVYIKGNRAFSFPYQEYEESELPKAKERSYGKLQWVWMQDTIFGTGEESIFLIRNVRSVENPDQSGILLLQLSNYFMDYALEQAGSSDQLSYYLFDGNRQLCYERSSSERSSDDRDRHTEEIVNMIDCIEEEGTRIVGIKGGILFSDYEINSGLTIVTEVPDHVIYEAARTVSKVLMLLAVPLLLIAAAVSMGVSFYFTKPIYAISSTMEKFDGTGFDDKLSVNTATELDIIGASYNGMLDRMASMVQEIRDKEKEVWELTMDSLYYQLNPHFLYNTLDNIYMMARLAKQQNIMKMTQALSTLLKISLNKGDGNVTVAGELDHVSSYLEIQKIRFGDKFHYKIQCDEKIKAKKIIKLILQPIVENSIKYGFAGTEEEGVILIQAAQMEESIIFSVYNSGNPIDEMKMEDLNRITHMTQEEMKQTFFTEKGGFGIYNIVTRMRMAYGAAFEIHYSKPESGGTLCTIKIPLEVN